MSGSKRLPEPPPPSPKKLVSRNVAVALGMICIVLVAGLVATIAVYASAISSLNSQLKNLQKQVDATQNATDFNSFFLEFGNVSVQGPNLDFSPPVDMYRALTIALESDNWNASSLSNMTVHVFLEYWEFWGNGGACLLHDVTQPAKDYSAVQVNGTTYRYIWDIEVEPSGNIWDIPPPGLYWVDAATGEIVPHGILV
jgi:hypothetical protein